MLKKMFAVVSVVLIYSGFANARGNSAYDPDSNSISNEDPANCVLPTRPVLIERFSASEEVLAVEYDNINREIVITLNTEGACNMDAKLHFDKGQKADFGPFYYKLLVSDLRTSIGCMGDNSNQLRLKAPDHKNLDRIVIVGANESSASYTVNEIRPTDDVEVATGF